MLVSITENPPLRFTVEKISNLCFLHELNEFLKQKTIFTFLLDLAREEKIHYFNHT